MQNKNSTFTVDGRQYTVVEQLGTGANTVAYLAKCRDGEIETGCILKEFAPKYTDDFDSGKARFIASAKTQNGIRQKLMLINQTPPISHVFEANGTAYIDVVCYNGTTLDKIIGDLTLPQYTEICRTIAKTAGYYHKSGYLCLDLKPENIFIMQYAPGDIITQLVEFIDFDSVCRIGSENDTAFSYTEEWAAPEQLNPYSREKIGVTADIYAVGELMFYFLFGRHSSETEHRGFSKYPFEECGNEYRKYTDRPDIQALFTELFHGTIRSSAANRFQNIDRAVELLDKLAGAMNEKDYVVPVLPAVSPYFTGRDDEITKISELLQKNHILYITGVGGIGKSSLIKNYISQYRAQYDIIVYLEYNGSFRRTFCDDTQLQISNVSRQDDETPDDYFVRKLACFRRICAEKRVLFVLDNFSGTVSKDMSRIFDCGYDTVILTREKPEKNNFEVMEVGAISDISDIFRLISHNLGRSVTKDERICFDEIIGLVQGHTLALELITKQIAAGGIGIRTALELIRENGFSRFSAEKIISHKDGEEVYENLATVITTLFDAENMSDGEKLAMKIFALLDIRGLEKSLVQKYFSEITTGILSGLYEKGWICCDDRVKLHPVIAETVQNWDWPADDVRVMDFHKKVTDIYAGMSDDIHIKEILREAQIYKEKHPRHIVNAIYYDMLGSYYDTLLDGAYYPENDEESELLMNLIKATGKAIGELQLSSDPRKTEYLIQNYLSLTNILLRSIPDYYDEAAKLLETAHELIEKNESGISENRCYYYMVSAWYYTLARPDIVKTRILTEKAEEIARQIFNSDLEIIDIVNIPAANCMYYHGDLHSAAVKIENALEICGKYPDMPSYIDKRAELLNILLDIYLAMGNAEKCRELIDEIDNINETYGEQGISRAVNAGIRSRLKK